LFGSADPSADADRQLVVDTIDAFVDTVEPRLRQVSRYRDKLAGNVAHTIAYLRQLATKLPREPHVLGQAAWSQDPYVRSYFAAADDVVRCIGRCDELRDFFESHAASPHACALLGMQRKERTVLAPRLEGDVLKQDVEQTTVSFGGHRLLAVAPDFAQSRLEVGRRIMERLAQLVLARVVHDGEQTQDQQVHKAMLATRLRMLRSAREGMAGLVEEGPSIEQQIASVERELQQLSAGQAAQGRTTLDSYLDQINAVLANPEQHVALNEVTLRLDRMGVKVEPAAAGEADTLELDELSIGEDLRATIAFVRIARDELPPKEDLLAQAQRSL
jgi:hypothetical protein